MAVDKTKDIQVGGTLHSIATGNVIAHADEVMDEDYGKKQSVINLELNNRLTEELKGYLPLTGGTLTSESGLLILQLVSSGNESSMFFKNGSSSWALGVGVWTHDGNFVIGNTVTSTYIQLKNDGTITTPTGVVVSGKSATDLLNAGGSTTPISDIVTQVQAAIVDSAPETLDTLNELAAALGDDPNFATTVTNQIASKVDKEYWDTLPNSILCGTATTTYSTDNICVIHQSVTKGDDGKYGSSTKDSRTINAATSTTAGVMTAEDFKKLSNITLGDNGISLIDFDSFSDDASYIKSYKRDGSNNGTTLEIHIEDNIVGADTDLDYIDFTLRSYGEENSTVVARISRKKLLSLNPTTNQLERVANISELPTIQSGQNGTTSNYIYSSAADEGYRVLSDISCTRTGDVVKLQGRTWGMPSNSSLDLVTLPLASSSMAGLMSTTDKSKLDQITITDGDIVASGFRITDGTANEVLTANGGTISINNLVGSATLSGFTESTEANENLEIEATDTINLGFGKLLKAIKDNELVIAEALNSIKDNLGAEDLNAALPDLSTTHYLGSATTFIDCLKALDNKLYEIEQALTLKTV